ncbi:flagellar motor switch protein FliG [Spongiibacter sp. KMU-158]|uniref:Flagellar motor switch protein FliG n=1 Tax=Spongiibacter pelagi TaxID=2760804 RepID=A0A927BZG4_9GAMM|nr:flagellar motor switch protein FliG [Spongiibacter pelagi]MBD2858433.1 flagellar motor switch protein FliG [Spongiibacter pelagi]
MISGSEKAALLLLMLGEDHASNVLKHVSPAVVEKIGLAMANVNRVDKARAANVVAEFNSALQAETPLGIGVQGYVRKLFTTTLGEQQGANMADRVLGEEEIREIDSLRWLEPEMIARMLEDEHPQIIAITLAHMENEQAAQVLKHFPVEVQDNIVLRIANMKTIPQSAMKQLEEVLRKKLSITTSLKKRNLDGPQAAASIINGLDTASETRILETVAKIDTALSDRIHELMFVFSNLSSLPDKSMQMLLREVSSDLLPVALKGADGAVREKILGNMSKRAREMLEEDMDTRGPMKLSDVESAQKEILAIARKLGESGQIELGRGGDDYI